MSISGHHEIVKNFFQLFKIIFCIILFHKGHTIPVPIRKGGSYNEQPEQEPEREQESAEQPEQPQPEQSEQQPE